MKRNKRSTVIIALFLSIAMILSMALPARTVSAEDMVILEDEEIINADASQTDNTVTLKPGDVFTVTEPGELFFDPAESRGYALNVQAEGNYSVQFYIYEIVSDEYSIKTNNIYYEIFRSSEVWNEAANTTAYSLNFSCPFFAEAGKKYKFGFSFFGTGGTPSEYQVGLIESDKAGITNDGLKYNTVQVINPSGEYEDVLQIIGFAGNASEVVVPGEIGGVPVRIIGDHAFRGCSAIERLVFSEGITEFRNYVCSGCTSLKYVELPSTLASIYNDPFEMCPIEQIVVPEGAPCRMIDDAFIIGSRMLGYYGTAEEYTVPDGVTFVEWAAFSGGVAKKLTLPESVIEFGRQDDENLEELHIRGSFCIVHERALAYTMGDNGTRDSLQTTVYIPEDSVILLNVTDNDFFPEKGAKKIEEWFSAVGAMDHLVVNEEKAPKEHAVAVSGDWEKVPPYSDGICYGVLQVKESGKYQFSVYGEDTLVSFTDQDGNEIACTYDSQYETDIVELAKGNTYLIRIQKKDNIYELGINPYAWVRVQQCDEIQKADQTITAKAAASSIAVGKTTTVKVTGAVTEVTYKSSDSTIATVSAAGKVTAKKVGTVKITASAVETDSYNGAKKTVTIKVVPAATDSLKAANVSTGVKLTWKKVTGATGYKVYRGSTLLTTIKKNATVTYTDTKAKNGTKYTYKIIPYASTGKGTAKSLTTYYVSRPAISSFTSTAAKKATVKWGKNSSATGYEIQFSLKRGFSPVAKTKTITKASTVAWTQTGLTAGKTYYVRVRTYKTVSGKKYYSEWSAAKTVKIKS